MPAALDKLNKSASIGKEDRPYCTSNSARPVQLTRELAILPEPKMLPLLLDLMFTGGYAAVTLLRVVCHDAFLRKKGRPRNCRGRPISNYG